MQDSLTGKIRPDASSLSWAVHSYGYQCLLSLYLTLFLCSQLGPFLEAYSRETTARPDVNPTAHACNKT